MQKYPKIMPKIWSIMPRAHIPTYKGQKVDSELGTPQGHSGPSALPNKICLCLVKGICTAKIPSPAMILTKKDLFWYIKGILYTAKLALTGVDQLQTRSLWQLPDIGYGYVPCCIWCNWQLWPFQVQQMHQYSWHFKWYSLSAWGTF